MDKFELLEAKYEQHFKVPFPTRIIGFWDPLHDRVEYIESEGLEKMKAAVDNAISKNEPLEEIPKDVWENVIF